MKKKKVVKMVCEREEREKKEIERGNESIFMVIKICIMCSTSSHLANSLHCTFHLISKEWKKITWREWEREEIRFIVLLGQLLCIFIFCLDKVFIKKKKLCKNYFFCHEHEWECVCVCVLVCVRARYSFSIVYHLKKIEW